MLHYILKRSAYSVLIILGVMVITFVLFRVAAGDPAATVLGKNPSAREIEDLRDSLGSNKPLFFGKWKQTEKYTSAFFNKERSIPGIEVVGKTEYKDESLTLSQGKISL